jgi:hypothetical protein
MLGCQTQTFLYVHALTPLLLSLLLLSLCCYSVPDVDWLVEKIQGFVDTYQPQQLLFPLLRCADMARVTCRPAGPLHLCRQHPMLSTFLLLSLSPQVPDVDWLVEKIQGFNTAPGRHRRSLPPLRALTSVLLSLLLPSGA